MRKKKVGTPEGVRYTYPHQEFWKLASHYPIKVISNSDKHKPDYVNNNLMLCKTFGVSVNRVQLNSLHISLKKKKRHRLFRLFDQ